MSAFFLFIVEQIGFVPIVLLHHWPGVRRTEDYETRLTHKASAVQAHVPHLCSFSRRQRRRELKGHERQETPLMDSREQMSAAAV